MALTLDDLLASPDHYLHSFEGDAAIFVPMDRAAYHRSIFLDGRIEPAGTGTMRLPVAAFAERVPAPAPTSWIFHIAHCGSTLLARALDMADANLVLREPLALRQVALAPSRDRLELVTAMLGKRYRLDTPTVVKANVPVNFLLPDLAARDRDMRAIFLYATLPDYLLAILRSDEHRGWLRRVTTQLAGPLGDLSPLGDGECAAALWLAQVRAFAAASALMPCAAALEAEAFFADPAAKLRRAATHLDVRLDDNTIARQVAGRLFATYSKNPAVAFDNAARLTRRTALRETLAGEIERAEAWIAGRGGEAQDALDCLAAIALDR